MKKSVISYLSLLAFVTAATVGAAIPTSLRIKKAEERISMLEEKRPDRSYTFEVDEHVIAELTSEVQEITHDMYLAHCVRGANECFIEVPVNDERKELELVYTGYIIKYTITHGIGSTKVSNNGWSLYEH